MDTLKLGSLRPAKNSRRNKRRKGRGPASGKGRSCTRGRGGSGHRAGLSRKLAFEGGQMPLMRRLPKRGFSNVRFANLFEIINLKQLQEKFKSGETVDPDILKERKLIKGRNNVKILANGDIKKKLTITGCFMSAAAKEKIEKAGGSVDV